MTIDVAGHGFDRTGATDNADKLAAIAQTIGTMWAAKVPLPRIVFPEGIYKFSAWPDLAYDNLQIVADGEVRLMAPAIVFDGSLRNPVSGQPGNTYQPNVNNIRFDGFDVYAPLTFRGIHRSKISARTFGQGIRLTFCIITELRPVVSGNGANPIGVLLDAWPGKSDLQSTATTIVNPCLEGCGVGIDMQSAGSCSVSGGTIESCALGVHLGPGAGNNMFYSVEMEGNGQDVRSESGAHNNGFLYCGNSGRINTNFGLFSSNWAKN